MKKFGVLIVCLILMFSISFVSAGWFGDAIGKITGNAVSKTNSSCANNECTLYKSESLTIEGKQMSISSFSGGVWVAKKVKLNYGDGKSTYLKNTESYSFPDLKIKIKAISSNKYVKFSYEKVAKSSCDTVNSKCKLYPESNVVLSNGKKISLNFISATEVKITYNGKTSSSLAKGQYYSFGDLIITIENIIYSSKDTATNNYVSIEYGENRCEEGHCGLSEGQSINMNGKKTTINFISATEVKLTYNGETTTSLSEGQTYTFKDIIITINDIKYSSKDKGFNIVIFEYKEVGGTTTSKESFSIKSDGDDSIILEDFPLKTSTEDINIYYFDNGAIAGNGKDADSMLRIAIGKELKYDFDTDDWFVASWSDGKSSESYLMRCTNFKNLSAALGDGCTFQYRKDKIWTDFKVEADISDTITMGNVEFNVDTISKTDKTVKISTTTTGVSFDTLYSKEGAKFSLQEIY